MAWALLRRVFPFSQGLKLKLQLLQLQLLQLLRRVFPFSQGLKPFFNAFHVLTSSSSKGISLFSGIETFSAVSLSSIIASPSKGISLFSGIETFRKSGNP